jgi:hypothetical protein
MAGNSPDGENRCDRIDQGEQQAAVKGGRSPERRRGSQPKGMGEEGPVRHTSVPEEAVNPVQDGSEPLGVEPGRQVALAEAVP